RGIEILFPVRGIEIPRGFQPSPKGDSVFLLNAFPPLKRRAIARRPAQAGLEQSQKPDQEFYESHNEDDYERDLERVPLNPREKVRRLEVKHGVPFTSG